MSKNKFTLKANIKKIISPNNSVLKTKRKKLPQLSNGWTNLYGLIAVLLVLIPEWLAEGVIIFSEGISRYQIPNKGIAWGEKDELRLACMSLVELRKLAKNLQLLGYSCDSRYLLTKRLLIKLNKTKGNNPHNHLNKSK